MQWDLRGIKVECCGPGYAGPEEAIRAPRELCFTRLRSIPARVSRNQIILRRLMSTKKPTFSKVIHRLDMPNIGDELHHMGWNACSSCHDDAGMRVNIFFFPACVQIISMSLIPRPICLRRASTPSLMVLRSNPRLTYLARIQCIALGAKSSFLFLAMQGRGAGWLPASQQGF